jgi:hypothetical protein
LARRKKSKAERKNKNKHKVEERSQKNRGKKTLPFPGGLKNTQNAVQQ